MTAITNYLDLDVPVDKEDDGYRARAILGDGHWLVARFGRGGTEPGGSGAPRTRQRCLKRSG